jgi:hypothetical protein
LTVEKPTLDQPRKQESRWTSRRRRPGSRETITAVSVSQRSIDFTVRALRGQIRRAVHARTLVQHHEA